MVVRQHILGGVLYGSNSSTQFLKTHGTYVPGYLWKSQIIHFRNGTSHVSAWLMPNTADQAIAAFEQKFRVTLFDIEQLTGLEIQVSDLGLTDNMKAMKMESLPFCKEKFVAGTDTVAIDV